MTEQTARTVANVVIGAAALAAAVVILRVPPLRRTAFGLARAAVLGGIPTWFTREVGQAWRSAGR